MNFVVEIFGTLRSSFYGLSICVYCEELGYYTPFTHDHDLIYAIELACFHYVIVSVRNSNHSSHAPSCLSWQVPEI